MKRFLFFMLAFSFLSCNNDKKVIDEENETISDTTQSGTVQFPPDTIQLNENIDTASEIIKPGIHNLTIQWISWSKPGKVTITKDTADWYAIKGSQQNQDGDYLEIEGKLKPFDKNELLFNGTISYKISSINNGIPCIKEGDQIFLSTKGRKYWRLQNMTSCDGGTTDYIDIYF